MAKKQVGVSLRKPPPAADFDSFVVDGSGGGAIATQPADAAAAPKAEVVITAHDGKRVREMTIYLDEEVAQRLQMHCREKDRDVSNFIAEAILALLAPAVKALPAMKPKAAPAKRAMKIEIPWAKWQSAFATLRSRLFPARA